MLLTLIKSTAPTPTTGTFSNLPDGSIVTINGNNFQASYSGGDGNDLTLTVVSPTCDYREPEALRWSTR